MPDTINVGSGGAKIFKATSLGTSQNYSLGASTSPLILTPPDGKVIRLDTLMLNGNGELEDTFIEVGGNEVIRGDLRVAGTVAGTFLIGSSAFSSGTGNFAYPVAYKEPIVATQPDESISISTTDISAETVFFTVSYGDLV